MRKISLNVKHTSHIIEPSQVSESRTSLSTRETIHDRIIRDVQSNQETL